MRQPGDAPPGEFFRDGDRQDEGPPRKVPRLASPPPRRGVGPNSAAVSSPAPRPGAQSAQSWRVGDRGCFVGASLHFQNGDQHIYGAEVEILVPTTPTGGHLVKFPGNKIPSDVASQDLSRERREIPGGWEAFDKAYFSGASTRFQDGDQQGFGTKVEVLGGSATPGSIVVKFPGNRSNSEVAVQHLTSEKREMVDRWRPWERAYFVGAGTAFSDGERHMFGAAVEVLGNAPEGEGLLVMFQHNRRPSEVSATDLSSEKIPLNGGWRQGEKAFFGGISTGYRNGDKEIFGAKVEILGNCSESGGLCVRFPANKAISHVNCGDVSRLRVEIVGGWLLQEKAFFKGRNESFPNGDKHAYGDRVDVVGNCSVSGGVAVKFPHNMGTSGVNPLDLTRERPSPQDAPEPVVAAQGNTIKWRYKASHKSPLPLRLGPTMGSQQTQDALNPGEAFDVDDMKKVVLGGQKMTFLHLADGRGWVFDSLPGVGTMCELVTSAAVERYGGCFLPRCMDGIVVLTEEAPGMYHVDNRNLNAETDGLGFRKSKKMSDQVGMGVYAAWGSVFEGMDAGDGWVMVRDKAQDAAAEAARARARAALPAQGASSRPLRVPPGGALWTPEAAPGPLRAHHAEDPSRGGPAGPPRDSAGEGGGGSPAKAKARPVMRQVPKAGKATPLAFTPAPKAALHQAAHYQEHGDEEFFGHEDEYDGEPG